MKSKLSFIRWKFVIPVAIFIAALLIFFILFFDPLFSRILESVASKANHAKVNITGLKTKLAQGRISIDRVQVTNKEQVMKNIVEAGPIVFQMDLSELFGKRLIIPQATLDGLKFNTDRASSGQLLFEEKPAPDEKPSVAAKFTEKYANRFKLSFEGMKEQAHQKIEFNPKDLALVKQADALKAKSTALPDQWKAKVAALNIDDRLKTIEKSLDEIKKTPTSGSAALTALPESLKKLKDVRSQLAQIKTDVNQTKNSLESELSGLKTDVASLSDAKRKDIDDLLSRFNLDFANPKKLADGVVGPVLVNRVKTGLGYLQMARKYMPSKKDEQIPPKPRARGMDIEFPTPAALPRFWLAKAGLSGTYEDVTATGEILDATSNPARIGKPLVVTLKGNQQGKLFALNGIVDQVSTEKKAQVDVSLTQLPLTQIMDSGFLANAVSNGNGNLDLALGIRNEEDLFGKIGFSMKNIRLKTEEILAQNGVKAGSSSKEDELKAKLIQGIAQGIEAMPSIEVSGKVSGTLSDPDISFETNLTSQMDKVVKSTVGNMVSEQRKELDAKLQVILNERQGELNGKLADMQSKLGNLFGGFDSKIQSKVNEASGVSLSPTGGSSVPKIKIPSLDKLFK